MSDPNILSPLSLHLSSAPPSPLFPSIPPSAFIPNSPSGPPSFCSASGLIRTRVRDSSCVLWCSCTTCNLFRGNGWVHFRSHRQETHRTRHHYRWSLFSLELWLMRELHRSFYIFPNFFQLYFQAAILSCDLLILISEGLKVIYWDFSTHFLSILCIWQHVSVLRMMVTI